MHWGRRDWSSGLDPHAHSYAEKVRFAREAHADGHTEAAFEITRGLGPARFKRRGKLWAFRGDEATRIYAMSAYRIGVRRSGMLDRAAVSRHYEKHPYFEPDPVYYFCAAVAAAPEEVRAIQSEFPLTDNARPLFERTVRYCTVDGGFRTRVVDAKGPDDTWWLARVKLTPDELAAKIREHYMRGEYGAARKLWENAGRAPFEHTSGYWHYRPSELNRNAALSEFQLAIQVGENDSDPGELLWIPRSFHKVDPSLSAHEYSVWHAFCSALRIAPKPVLAAAAGAAMKPWTVKWFERAKSDPLCHANEAWRSREAPFPDP